MAIYTFLVFEEGEISYDTRVPATKCFKIGIHFPLVSVPKNVMLFETDVFCNETKRYWEETRKEAEMKRKAAEIESGMKRPKIRLNE